MKNTVAKALFIAALAGASAFAVPAQADRNSYDRNWNHHIPNDYVDQYSKRFTVVSHETLSIAVKQKVRNRTLPLRKMFGLNRNHSGQSIEKIVVYVKPTHRKAKLRLIANGRVVDRVTVRNDRAVVLDPNRHLKIGHNLSNLRLEVDGKVNIRRITMELYEKRPRYVAHRGYQKSNAYDPVQLHKDLARNLRIIFSKSM